MPEPSQWPLGARGGVSVGVVAPPAPGAEDVRVVHEFGAHERAQQALLGELGVLKVALDDENDHGACLVEPVLLLAPATVLFARGRAGRPSALGPLPI